jgi:hypothetical protein
MTILDEKEQTVSLKLIVVIVGVITFGAFGTLFFATGAPGLHEAKVATQETL